MKTLFVFLALLLFTITVNAQSPTYKIGKNNELIKVENTLTFEKTQYTIKIKDSIYPVYKTTNNKFFIVRTSKKGNQYKQYINIL